MPPVTPYTFHRTLSKSDLGPEEPASSASNWIRRNNLHDEEMDVVGPTRTVKVSNQTLENLRLATKVNREVKRLLPFGSPNMVVDLHGTQGENWLRQKQRGSRLRMPGVAAPNYTEDAEKILRTGAGNCAEHAEIAFQLLTQANPTQPLTQVKDDSIDHTFVVIGDLAKDPAECVVVDPWPIVPIAHTLDRGDFEPGRKLREHLPGASVEAPNPANSTLLTPQELSAFGAKRQCPPAGPALLQKAYNDRLQRTRYQQITSTSTPNTTYVNIDNENDRFDANTIVDEYADLKARFLKAK